MASDSEDPSASNSPSLSGLSAHSSPRAICRGRGRDNHKKEANIGDGSKTYDRTCGHSIHGSFSTASPTPAPGSHDKPTVRQNKNMGRGTPWYFAPPTVPPYTLVPVDTSVVGVDGELVVAVVDAGEDSWCGSGADSVDEASADATSPSEIEAPYCSRTAVSDSPSCAVEASF